MKKATTRIVALLVALTMLSGITVSFTACKNNAGVNNGNGDTTNDAGAPPESQSPKDEYSLEKEEGCNQLTFYWRHDGTYENCDIWIWYGDKAGQGHLFH